MKKKQFHAVIPWIFGLYLVVAVFLPGCAPDLVEQEKSFEVEYAVSGDINAADVSYLDKTGDIVFLEAAEIPWAQLVEVPLSSHNLLYIKAEAWKDKVFIPYREGRVTRLAEGYLVDDTGGFDGQAEKGDFSFVGPDFDFPASKVRNIESDTRLELVRHIFLLGTEDYRLYHEKSITVSIAINGELIASEEVTDLVTLSCFVQAKPSDRLFR